MDRPFSRATRAIVAVGAAIVGFSALGAGVQQTLSQRQVSEYAAAEFTVTVPEPVFDIEGSADGQAWDNDPASFLTAEFNPDAMALNVGEPSAVYAPMHVRTTVESDLGGTATLSASNLPDSEFTRALRTEVFSGVDTCSAAGTAGGTQVASGDLLGMVSDPFEIAPPTVDEQPGPIQTLCTKVWLDNNNFLLGGERSDTVTAQWAIDATAQEP